MVNDYFIVTTALEDTWPENNQPILFLGEWCRLYSRAHRWRKLDAKLLPYHWDDRKKLFVDYQYIRDLHERLLYKIAADLNKIHGVDHTVRYWRILIGPWLMMFLPALFDRWESVNAAIASFPNARTIVTDESIVQVTPQSMDDFCTNITNDKWNHGIYSQVFKYLKFGGIDTVELPKNVVIERETLSPKVGIKGIIKKIIVKSYTFLVPNSNFFFISTYLCDSDFRKLHVKLNQLPLRYSFSRHEKIEICEDYRKWDLSDFVCSSKFEKFAIKMVPTQLPAVYLEGYKKLFDSVKKSRLPKSPKLIWTSNSFFMDEGFKLWAAEKIDEGVPLVIGQHGGHYGQGKFSCPEYHEKKICDHYLTWGWGANEPNIKPIGIFKKPLKKNRKSSTNKSALLMISASSRYSNNILSIPIASQWLKYWDDQIEFFRKLPSNITENVTVRLYHSDHQWDQYDRWKKVFPDSSIDSGKLDYYQLLKKTKLVISGWNSTTYLESMSADVPTVIFWNPNYFEMRKEAREFLCKLKEVGIYHDNPMSAAAHVVKRWEEIEKWWHLPVVVSAKNEFLEKYARSSNIVSRLNLALREISENKRLTS
jgi:putative transferase (TIGR04331 family)